MFIARLLSHLVHDESITLASSLSARIQFKIFILIQSPLFQNILGITFALLYLQLHIGHIPLFGNLNWQVFFVPRVRTTMVQTRSVAVDLPFWMPFSLRLTLLSGLLRKVIPASFSLLKAFLYFRSVLTTWERYWWVVTWPVRFTY